MEENFKVKYVDIKLNLHKPPVFKEAKDQRWITFGTEKPFTNRICDYYLMLYQRANKHSALIDAKVHFIAGNGVEIDYSGLLVGDQARLNYKLKNSNEYGEDVEDLIRKVAIDYEIYNGAYLEVNWAASGKSFTLTHLPFGSLRIGVDKKFYCYSRDWSKPKSEQTKDKTGYEEIPVFDPKSKKGKQVYALKAYHPGIDYYPLPNYLGAVAAAETEVEIANYHLNSIKSGFHIGTIITFQGKPTPEEQEQIEKALKEKFEGTDMAGSLLLQFTRDKDGAPVITRISPDELDKKFETLTKQVEQELTVAHHINPMLAGLKTEGQLGGRSELEVAYEQFKNSYVIPRQREIERWINKLYSFIGFDNRIRLKEAIPVNPIEYKDILQDMDRNERRKLRGLPPIEEKVQDINEAQAFSSQENKLSETDVIELFMSAGETSDSFERLTSTTVSFDGTFYFGDDLTETDKKILALIEKDPKVEIPTLAKALKISESKVVASVDSLAEGGYLTESGKVNKAGRNVLSESAVENTEIRYSYELAPGVKGPGVLPDGRTRPFCEKLFSSNKLFTRAEIDAISNKAGYSVWEFRGGWWNKGGVNVPQCRHIWKAHIVKRKS